MANLIPIMGRAATTDAQGDLVPVTDATISFFESGSSTPLTVYTDSSLTTPRGTSVAGDADGFFPQCWTDKDLVKLTGTDGSGVNLDGLPQDGVPCLPIGGTTATATTFTPVTGNTATNTQTAVANNVARINTADNASRLTTSTGSGGTYALTSAYSITAYAVGQEYEFIANHASVGSGSDTLNVDTVGAAVIKKYSGSTSKADLAAGDIAIGDVVRVKHDGTNFVVCKPIIVGATETAAGIVEAATTSEMTAKTANKFPDAAKVGAYVDLAEGTEQATTSGTEVDFTIPAGAQMVQLPMSAVGVSGTDDLLIQLGDSGGIETTGYVSGSGYDTGNDTSTSGFVVALISSRDFTGMVTLVRKDSANHEWICTHAGVSTDLAVSGGGSKTLSAELTTVRITRTGTDTLNSGSANTLVHT